MLRSHLKLESVPGCRHILPMSIVMEANPVSSAT